MATALAGSSRVDVAIFGGGIAGLWLLAELRQAGYAALLLECESLGAGQTLAAQGIIHSGVKYTIGRKGDPLVDGLAQMPEAWRRALAGKGAIDLSAVPLNARHCHLWLPPSVAGTITGIFASRALRAKTRRLAPDDWPVALKGNPVGTVYALEEPVVDVPALIRALAAPYADVIRKIPAPNDIRFETDGAGVIAASLFPGPDGKPVALRAQRFIFAAGGGNEALLAALPGFAAATQRRPLRMLLVKGDLRPLYAHCFTRGDTPRLTITSHRATDGAAVWYVGGALAESGAQQDEPAFFAAARETLGTYLPTLKQSGLRLASLRVDRAEAARPRGRRPEGPATARHGNAIAAWPTKLAFAPRLAEIIRDEIQTAGIKPDAADLGPLAAWPHPGFGAPPWDKTQSWR